MVSRKESAWSDLASAVIEQAFKDLRSGWFVETAVVFFEEGDYRFFLDISQRTQRVSREDILRGYTQALDQIESDRITERVREVQHEYDIERLPGY